MVTDAPIELVVFSAGGVMFGASAGQVAAVVPAAEHAVASDDGGFAWTRGDDVCQGLDFGYWLRRYRRSAPCPVGSAPPPPSKLLLIPSSPACAYRAVGIETIEHVLTVARDELFPLPVFIRKTCQWPALWGFAYHEFALVLLIDLFQLTVGHETDATR